MVNLGIFFLFPEAILRLNINDNNQEVGFSKLASYPDRPGERDCSYYLRTGLCGYGSNCRFNHPAYDAQVGKFLFFFFLSGWHLVTDHLQYVK